jgi:hypothetical protein
MRRLYGIFILIVFSAVFAFAQEGERRDDRDDHDDKAPIQAGYAVITPLAVTTSSSTSGLVVFETFGLRGNDGGAAKQAGVLPPDLTTSALLFVEANGRLSKNLGVAIVNPNASNVNVSLTLRKSDGTQFGSPAIVNIPSHQQVSKLVTELFATQHLSDILGTLVVTSVGTSGPVSVIGLRFRGQNFSTLPITNLAGNVGPLPSFGTGIGGDGAVLLPQFAANGGWATEIVMVNTSMGTMTVRVDLFKPDGTPLTASLNGTTASSFTNLTIPPGGVLTLAPRDRDGDDDF